MAPSAKNVSGSKQDQVQSNLRYKNSPARSRSRTSPHARSARAASLSLERHFSLGMNAERQRENELDQSHEAPICYRNHHLRRPDINIAGMDDIRKSFSKLKKDFKHRLGGKKRAADEAGANAAGETASSPPSLMHPSSHVTVSGHDEEGSIIGADVSQSHSRNSSPHPELMPADEGHRDDSQRKEIDVGEKEVSKRHSHPDDIEATAGGEPSKEVNPVSSPLSVTPIAPKQELDSM